MSIDIHIQFNKFTCPSIGSTNYIVYCTVLLHQPVCISWSSEKSTSYLLNMFLKVRFLLNEKTIRIGYILNTVNLFLNQLFTFELIYNIVVLTERMNTLFQWLTASKLMMYWYTSFYIPFRNWDLNCIYILSQETVRRRVWMVDGAHQYVHATLVSSVNFVNIVSYAVSFIYFFAGMGWNELSTVLWPLTFSCSICIRKGSSWQWYNTFDFWYTS